MADVGANLGGACCAIFNFSWFYNSRIGTDITCFDKCCRCHCCDDKGALPEDEQPGRRKRQEEAEAARRAAQGKGDEDLPAYQATQPAPTEAMSVPVGAVPTTTAAKTGAGTGADVTGATTEGGAQTQAAAQTQA